MNEIYRQAEGVYTVSVASDGQECTVRLHRSGKLILCEYYPSASEALDAAEEILEDADFCGMIHDGDC